MYAKKNPIDTLTFKLTLSMLCCILPLIIVAVYNNIQSYLLITRQIQDTHTYALGTYVNQLDQEFYSASQYLSGLAFDNSDVMILKSGPRTNDYYYSSYSIHKNMANHLMLYQHLDGLLLYAPGSHCYLRQFSNNAGFTVKESASFEEAIQSEILCGENRLNQWKTLEFNDKTYLFWVNYNSQLYTSYFFELQKLEEILSAASNQDLRIRTNANQLLTFSPENDSWIPIYCYSTNSPLILEELFSKKDAFQSMPLLQRYYIFVVITMILTLPAFYLLIRRLVYEPLNYINKSMSRIQSGDIEYRLNSEHTSSEFQVIHQSFNHMMDELGQLRIGIYEEQLKNQRAEMNNILIQLRPHFLINTLNMLYNMIILKNLDNAGQLIRFATNYLRYMVNTTQNFVPLKEELEHMQNYLGIQTQRYEGRFVFSMQVDPFIKDTVIPPFLLQNFIENSIKYGLNPDSQTQIYLQISYLEKDFEPMLYIYIHDNGNGYPQNFLDSIQSDSYLDKKDGHIGVRNSLNRLRFLYHGKAAYRFGNDNGATTELYLPLQIE